MSRQNIRLLSSTAWHRLTTFRRPLPILHIMDSGRRINCTQRPRSRISPACSTSSAGGSVRRISAHVQQPSLLNIDLHSTVREQQVQTSNTISTDKYNPVRNIHQTHAKHLKCYTCTWIGECVIHVPGSLTQCKGYTLYVVIGKPGLCDSCGYSCDNSADFQQSNSPRFSVCSVTD